MEGTTLWCLRQLQIMESVDLWLHRWTLKYSVEKKKKKQQLTIVTVIYNIYTHICFKSYILSHTQLLLLEVTCM